MTAPNTQLVRVYFNDMSFKTFAVTPETTAGELCDMFAKKMRLKDTTIRHFTLNIVVNGQQLKRLGNILGRPYQEQKDFLAQNIGWGASNLNCFLFSLKSETAKRMSACLANPHRREIAGSTRVKKPDQQQQPQVVNGRRVIASAVPQSHVANAGVPEDPPTHLASFSSYHPSNPALVPTKTIGSNRTRTEPQRVPILSLPPSSPPSSSDPFPLASSATTPPMPSMLRVSHSPPVSPRIGSPPSPPEDAPIDSSSPDQSVLYMLDKARNNVGEETNQSAIEDESSDSTDFEEYQDLIKVLAQLSK